MTKKVLSIDPGVTSIGWTLTEQNEKGHLTKFIDGGSRIFNSVKEAKSGTFKNEKRRAKRTTRRNKYRSNRRMAKLENYLIKNDFLSNKISTLSDHTGLVQQIIGNPYHLRKKALYEPLTNEELAWAIIHLAKRRGFLSSSKSLTPEEKKEQARADELATLMKKEKCKTLGEYFSNLYDKGEKIRGEKLKRQLIQDELELILNKQMETNSLITEEFINDINTIIFNQRPLKTQKRISLCKFESFGKIKKHTAAKLHPLSQQFILWGFINNLKYNDNSGGMQELTLEQKNVVFDLLWTNKEVTFKKIIKELKLTPETTFNFQKNEADKVKGNQLLNYFKAKTKTWFNSLSEQQKIDLIQDLSTINDLTGFALKKRIYNHWTKDEGIMDNLLLTSDKLPQGYTSLSLKATKKILPFLKAGDKYYEAEKKAYPNFTVNSKKVNKLPPVEGISNTVVLKSCSQVRHLVNAIVDKYGEIDIIKIELARDLSKSKKQISETNILNSQNKSLNDEAISYLHKNNIDVNHDNITKYKLWKESESSDKQHRSCYPEQDSNGNWFFPTINLSDLYGANAIYEIEHIIPKSISGDDSFANKALCKHKTNAQKGNKTPYDYYFQKGGQELIDMIAKTAYSQFGKWKGKKFVTSTEKYLDENDIQKRYLNDTRYLAVFLKEYLQPVCKDKIVVSKGGFTAIIRQSLNLNILLGNEFNKNRGDYRHHMVDAFCTSLISPKVLDIINIMRKQFNKKTEKYKECETKLNDYIKNVKNDFIKHFDNVITSHEVESKLKGELEEETLYGHEKIKLDDGSIITKLFQHKPYEEVILKYNSPKEVLKAHDNLEISLPKGLKKYLENNNKLPDMFQGWKRIKKYYNNINENNFNINIYRAIHNEKEKVIAYKKTQENAYIIVYNDFKNETISKMNEISNKPKFNNVFCKLYKGDLIQDSENNIYKIYQLLSDKRIALHPVNIQPIKTKRKSVKLIFDKEKMYKIKVNILGHII